VRGVRYETPQGPREGRALLTVAADGRSSPFREQAGLKMVRTSPPIDVLWFRLSRQEGDPGDTFGYAGNGRFMAIINRGEYWQIAYAIRKDGYQSVRAGGLDAFRRSVGEATVPESYETGMTSSFYPCRPTDCDAGTGLGCYASGMPRTPCLL
jgi:2-polyprenyl-6-methoxyphenol hydroxylase-like FAD-dependent oxidoreductase